MAQILNHNPEDNPRLSQIYEILLLAGYFRIRIASLKAFDKVIGGIAWCITSSNFQIEVEYSDEMQIGQKIRVSEHICNALQNMKCPFTLQPFQLQGLDVNNIFPVVQWLVKFVYETRFQRQKYNRQISVLLGKEILKLQNKGNADKICINPPQRSRINRQITHSQHDHPIRVYSSLLEYNDATAVKMYNKLHNIMAGKMQKEKNNSRASMKEEKEREEEDLVSYLQKEDENQQDGALNNFGTVGNISLTKLQKIIEENKHQLQQAIMDKPLDEIPQNLGRTDSTGNIGSQDKELRSLKLQNDKFQVQLQVLKNQLANLSATQKQIEDEKRNILEKKQAMKQKFDQVNEKYQEIDEIGTQIENQLATKQVNVKVEKLVDKKMKLKQKKGELKKKAKGKLDELEQQRMIVEASVPQIDEEAFKNMLEQAQTKKSIYDKKYEDLTKLNQELAILQRKAEDYTSPAQIAQYHQRFVELFQAINCSIEQKRSFYNQMTNLQSIRKLISNYQGFLDDAKGGVTGARKKKQKAELAVNLKQILRGFEVNKNNANVTLAKLKSNRQASYSAYMDLIKLQREYLKVLRSFKVEYQNMQKFYK